MRAVYFSKQELKINDLIKFILSTKASNPYHPSMRDTYLIQYVVAFTCLKSRLDYVFISLLIPFLTSSVKEKALKEFGISKRIKQ